MLISNLFTLLIAENETYWDTRYAHKELCWVKNESFWFGFLLLMIPIMVGNVVVCFFVSRALTWGREKVTKATIHNTLSINYHAISPVLFRKENSRALGIYMILYFLC